MSCCKNNAIVCDKCNLFCTPHDSETPFGSQGEEGLDPLDPYHYCKNCAKELQKEYESQFEKGERNGCWQKSDAEMTAAKKCGLVWVGGNGIGKYGTDLYKNYCYIDKKEYKLLSK